ncbi:DUF255 domain-containing protein [Salarchaeum japonicum]|uniref:DUF255 domain-containing protein n=1 Tax=Salarchaeum japonicum TaxID=555573 RepID=UPI003C76F172
MDESADATKVEWREWGEEAFEAAAEAEKPLLLSLVTRWSRRCREMDEGAYADPRVAANLNEEFVPVRADADRHPRVRERYNMGGFPSTVFLTPSGAHIAGATYLDTDGFRQVIERVHRVWEDKGADAARVPRALREPEPPAGEVTAEIERLVAGQLDEKFDSDFAGWGSSEKFPLPDTIEFALKRERHQATQTLDVLERNLQADSGAFGRFAHGRDWSDPQREYLLETNAALLRAYSHAYLVTGDESYESIASDLVDYLTGTLWTGDAFGNAELAEADARTPVDDTAFVTGNARAADALAWYAAYADDDTARRYAERTLDFLDTLVDDGTLVHFDDPNSESGLLADHAAATRAYATAAQTLDRDYLDRAEAVASDALDRLQSESGAFDDGPRDGVGLLDKPLHPIDDNALLANALVDLRYLADDPTYREAATDAVGAFAGAAERMGVQVAGYATAASRLVTRPLTIEVGAPAGSDLHRAAVRLADHEKVVVPDAPAVDSGTARVVTADATRAGAETPAELADLVQESL